MWPSRSLIPYLLLLSVVRPSGATEVGSVRITGNELFSARDLKNRMDTKPGAVFDGGILRADILRILDQYAGSGYWTATVQDTVLPGADGEVAVRLIVWEGERTRLNAVHVRGARLVNEEEILRRMETRVSDAPDASRLNEDIEHLLTFYENNGHPFCEIRPDLRMDERGQLDLTLWIDEGPQTYIGRIVTVGNRVTRSRTIERAFPFAPGARYDQRAVDRGYRNLLRLGIFERVDPPEIRYDAGAERMALVVRMQERRPSRIEGAVGYVPGVSSRGGHFAGWVDLSFANLLGTGRRAEAKWSRKDPDASDLELGYREPWVFDLPADAWGTFRHMQRLAYTSTSATLSLEMPISTDLFGEGEIAWEKVVPDSTWGTGMAGSRTWTIGFGATYDLRDDPLNPMDGLRYRIFVHTGGRRNIAVGGAVPEKARAAIGRFRIDLEHFLPVFRRQVVAFAVHGEQAWTDEQLLPLSEKLFLGGARTLRGYREEQFWGYRIAWGSLEYRRTMSRRSRAFLFFDTGAFWDRRKRPDGRIETIRGVRAGYGVGLRAKSRVGIVGIDYGLGSGDRLSEGKIHVGMTSEF